MENTLTDFKHLYIAAQFGVNSRTATMDIDDRDRYEERELQCDMCSRDDYYDNDSEIDRDRFSSEKIN